jgi:hypothetical protein
MSENYALCSKLMIDLLSFHQLDVDNSVVFN